MFHLVLCVISLLGIKGATSQSHNDQQRLYDHLFSDYNKYIRPIDGSGPTMVDVAFLPHRLIDFDEKNQIIYLFALFFNVARSRMADEVVSMTPIPPALSRHF